jgi:hypothetical protein
MRGERTRVAVHRNDVLVFEPAVPYAGGVLLNALLGAGVVALYLMSEGDV